VAFAVALAAATAAACANDDRGSPSTSVTPSGVQPQGFSTITARITDASGDVCEVCLWLADDGDERGRGLMDVTDLGEPVGMAFVFEAPIEGAFYMYRTPTPLSIAWFGPDGAYVGAAEMEPCLDTPSSECARYAPGSPYEVAVEVVAGGLGDLGIGPGARIDLVAGSEAESCPADPSL
jgi:uncharacterized protein